jgi:hypothetical protein
MFNNSESDTELEKLQRKLFCDEGIWNWELKLLVLFLGFKTQIIWEEEADANCHFLKYK